MMKSTLYEAFCDGSASPNPGKMGIGFSVFKDKREVFCGAAPRGHGSNNEAEYLALIWTLESCIEKGITDISVFADSQLVVKQVNGEWNIGNERLAALERKVSKLKPFFDTFLLSWVKREKNARADALSKRGVALTADKIHVADPKLLPNEHKERDKLSSNTRQKQCHQATSRITVLHIHNELVVIEQGQRHYFDLIREVCSCDEFAQKRSCRHKSAFLIASKKLRDDCAA